MTFGSGCLLAVGILLLLFGGCTVLVSTGPSSHELGDMSGLAAIGVPILLLGAAAVGGAIYLVKRHNATRPGAPTHSPPLPPDIP
jgi:hypothetical protein